MYRSILYSNLTISVRLSVCLSVCLAISYTLGEVLGKGAFSTVRLATMQKTKKKWAGNYLLNCLRQCIDIPLLCYVFSFFIKETFVVTVI